jgi:Ca2+-binding RTX toxin-like protein
MTFPFNPTQLTELQSALNSARATVSANPNAVGAYSSAYQLVFSMITNTDTQGNQTPKSGVDPAAWVFIRGVADVNAGVGDYSEFIRNYTKEQYKTRFGENALTEAQLDVKVQNVSDAIADNILKDILNINLPIGEENPNHYLPTAQRIANLDAQAVAQELFNASGENQIAGWAGNPLFVILGVATPFRENILHQNDGNPNNDNDTYDLLTVISGIMKASSQTGVIDSYQLLENIIKEVIPDSVSGVLDGIIRTYTTANAVTDVNNLLVSSYGINLAQLIAGTTIYGDIDDIYLGTKGNDILEVGDPFDDDLIHAGAGDDTIKATHGDDFIDGGEGIDTIDYSTFNTGIDNDIIVDLIARTATIIDTPNNDDQRLFNIENVNTGDGDDVIHGSNSNVRNVINSGNNSVDGIDEVHGLGGDDLIDGGAGNDNLYGDAGNDVLLGDTGNDNLYGGANNDELLGGTGKDVLNGNSGNDILTGGADADKFVIARQLGGATTIIKDFSTSTVGEKIDLSAFGNVTSFNSLQRTNVNGNTEITLNNAGGASQKLILEGVVSSSLTADDFILGSYEVSSNFQVDVTDTDSFLFGYPTSNSPKVAELANGNFFMFWTSLTNSFQYSPVSGQMFDSNGVLIGQPISLVGNSDSDEWYSVSTITLDNGNFLVTWGESVLRSNGDFLSKDFYGQKFSSSGEKIGSAFVFDTAHLDKYDKEFSIAYDVTDDNLVMVRRDNIAGVYGQIFSSNGSKIGNEFEIDGTAVSTRSNHKIAELADGNFIATWQNNSTQVGIYGQKFSSTGTKIGGEMLISNSTNTKFAFLENGNFVLTYDKQISGNTDVYAQIFNSNGVAIGNEFLVNTNTLYNQNVGQIAKLADGGFVITWIGGVNDNNFYAQTFSADGSKVGGLYSQPFNNSIGSVDATSISFASYTTGNFVATKIAPSSGQYNLYAKVFALSNDQEVYGSTLAENIVGSSGSDLILSGGGNDTITGGGGADTFVMSVAAASEVTITDFEADNPNKKIDITAFNNIHSFSDLTITAGSAIVHLGNGQTIHITNLHPEDLSADNFIFAPNDAPVAVVDTGSVLENGTIDIDVIANDTDANNDALSVVSIDTSTTTGLATIDVDGTIIYNPNGKFEYLAEGSTATDSFTYTISDGNGGFDTETVTVTITGQNDAPYSLSIDNVVLNENAAGAIIGNISFGDVDVGDSHTFTTDNPAIFEVVGGQLKLVSGVSLNYEVTKTVNVLVTVTDSANTKFSSNITLSVNDVVDVIVGTNGNETLVGGSGQDIIYAGAGDDIIYAVGGNDTVYAGAGSDTIYAGEGNDTVYGSTGDDVIYGGNGIDVLYGEGGNDQINAGADNYFIIGGEDYDAIDGGSGIDTASYAGSTSAVGIDLLNAITSGGYAVGDTLTGIENLTGSDFNDTLIGDNNANIIVGGVGNDTLSGNDGSDTLTGGAGSDLIYGGLGNDNIHGGSGVDYFSGGAGIDYFAFKALTDSNTTYGIDTIVDFQDGIDKIDLLTLDASGISSFADLIITNNGTQTTVADNSSDFAIKLTGVFALDNADFVF